MGKIFIVAGLIALNIILALAVDEITDGDEGTEGKNKRQGFYASTLGGYPGAYAGYQDLGYGGRGGGGVYPQRYRQQQYIGRGYENNLGAYQKGIGGYGIQQPLYSNNLGYPGLSYSGIGGGYQQGNGIYYGQGLGALGIGHRGVGYGGYLRR